MKEKTLKDVIENSIGTGMAKVMNPKMTTAIRGCFGITLQKLIRDGMN